MVKMLGLLLLLGVCLAKKTHIAIVGTCNRTFLEPLISIALELSNRAKYQITIVVPEKCEFPFYTYNFEVKYAGRYPYEDPEMEAITYWLSNPYENHDKQFEYFISEFLPQLEAEMVPDLVKLWSNSTNQPELIITNPWGFAGMDIAEILGVKLVVFLDFLDNYFWLVPEATQFTYLPCFTTSFHQKYPDSYFERLWNLVQKYRIKKKFSSKYYLGRNKVRKELGLKELECPINGNCSTPPLYFIGTPMGYEAPRPLPTNFVLIGNPLQIESRGHISSELTTWLDKSQNYEGFLFVAFGENWPLSENDIVQMRHAFRRLKMRVLIANKALSKYKDWSNNVWTETWVNQREVLRHSQCKAYYFHGGMISATEGILAEKPLICMPLALDGYQHCRHLRDFGAAFLLDRVNLTSAQILDSVDKVVSDPSFKEKSSDLKKLFVYQGGETLGADMIELAVNYGYEALIPKWYDIPWVQLYDLDIYSVLLSIFILLYKLSKYFVRWILRKKKAIK